MLRQQSGVSLLEVLIALLLLAVAVLGFSAMQMRAVKATDETLYRSDALVAIRNISEDLRLLPTETQRKLYTDYIKENAEKTSLTKPKDCDANSSCSTQEQMAFNAYQSMVLARDYGVNLSAQVCPGTENSSSLQKMCIVAAWNETKPTMADAENSCTDANGVYKPGATCFVVETY